LSLSGWFEAFLRRRFAWLLGLLLVTIGVDPALEAMGLRGRALEWMLALALLAAVAGSWRGRASHASLLCLAMALAARRVRGRVRPVYLAVLIARLVSLYARER
jgi:hypothetical protein